MATPQLAGRQSSHPRDDLGRRTSTRFSSIWSSRFFRVSCLVISDLATILFALGSAVFIRSHFLVRIDKSVPPLAFPVPHYLRSHFLLLWLVFIVFLAFEGLYTQRRTFWTEMEHTLKATSFGVITILGLVTLAQWGPLISRFTIVAMGVLLLPLLPLSRSWVKRLMVRTGIWSKRILILGAGQASSLLVSAFHEDPVLGYEPVGFLDDDPELHGTSITFGERHMAVLGPIDEAEYWMRQTDAKDILIAMPGMNEQELLGLLYRLQPVCESICVVPNLWALPTMNLKVDAFLRERVLMLKLSNNLAKPWNMWFKRGFDLVVGLVLACLALPLCGLIALLIRLDSDGPAILAQVRLGFRNRTFRCLKFRTMHLDSEKRIQDFLAKSPEARQEWSQYAKLRVHDPRVTKVGRLLRRWSLDELPQFLNVLRGEMSLVGPRPYLPAETRRIGSHTAIILSARPGITGFWQVNGRNHLTFDERVSMDEWYVRNWSVWLDFIVLAKTFRAVRQPVFKNFLVNN